MDTIIALCYGWSLAEADLASLTSLLVGLRSLPAMRFILDIVVESGHLELLLQKLAWVDVVDADRALKRAVEGLRTPGVPYTLCLRITCVHDPF